MSPIALMKRAVDNETPGKEPDVLLHTWLFRNRGSRLPTPEKLTYWSF